MKIVNEIKNDLIKAIKKAESGYSDLYLNQTIEIEHPKDVNFGDYSTNIAMVLSKKFTKFLGGHVDSEKNPGLKKTTKYGSLNPYEYALKIVEEFNKNSDFIDKIEVVKPGFINFYLKPEFLIKEAELINYEIEFRDRLRENGNNKTMVIDYSAPNIAKPFGIGHLRSTDIGQAIYNIYKILGWNCIGDNHIGDWGTQYGKLMAAIKKWNDKDLDDLTIEDLEKLYVKFHKEAETDETLVDEGRNWFSKLENNDSEAREIWKKCVEISLVEFDKVYEMLGVKIDFIHGESFYQDKLEETIKEIKDKKITKESEGAVIVEMEGMPPAMLQKSNGTTTYFTRDMATVKYRVDNWNPDLIVYEVGADQQLHFKQVFETAKLMGWTKNCEMVHVAHGLIRWPTGKFSTRKGDTIHLSDVIEKAKEKARELAEKSKVIKDLNNYQKEEVIEKVAIGAIKFSDLSSDPKKDIIFNWDQVMSLDGDSGPYLQYTLARCLSVLNKTQINEQKNIEEIPKTVNKDEMALIREFYKFEEKIIEASERFSPAVITEYLIGIARKYNEFYAKNRIINQKEETFRIFLTKTVAMILETGLNLLGIDKIEKM